MGHEGWENRGKVEEAKRAGRARGWNWGRSRIVGCAITVLVSYLKGLYWILRLGSLVASFVVWFGRDCLVLGAFEIVVRREA